MFLLLIHRHRHWHDFPFVLFQRGNDDLGLFGIGPRKRLQRFLETGGQNPSDLLMPTVLRSGPYRAFFYAGDRHEPPHVHIERDRSKAKYWLEPVARESSSGFSRGELMGIYRLILEQQVLLLEKWHDYFGD